MWNRVNEPFTTKLYCTIIKKEDPAQGKSFKKFLAILKIQGNRSVFVIMLYNVCVEFEDQKWKKKLSLDK